MRHGKKFNHLGRKKGHRRALLMNLANALIEHKRINTTLAKAKALRVYVEPLITKGKKNTTHSRRVVFAELQSKHAIQELFGTIASAVADRPGGYTRVLKTGFRKGDGAEMAMIELVDFNDVYSKANAGKTKTTRRSRRKKSKSNDDSTTVDSSIATEVTTASKEKASVATKIAVETVAKETVTVDTTPIEVKANDVVEKVEKKVEEVKSTASNVVEKVEKKVEEVKATANDVVEKVEEKVEEVKTTTNDVVEKVEKKVEEVKATVKGKADKDDLTKIEGIGPKIAELLNNAGINSFNELAESNADRIKEILTEAGSSFSVHNPTTWAMQSQMAADGKWDELKKWQDESDGGKPIA